MGEGGGGRGTSTGRDRVLAFSNVQRRADSADGMARDEHNLEVVGASLGKGEADIQEMDGVLGKRAGCGRWGNKKLTHLGGLGR